MKNTHAKICCWHALVDVCVCVKHRLYSLYSHTNIENVYLSNVGKGNGDAKVLELPVIAQISLKQFPKLIRLFRTLP